MINNDELNNSAGGMIERSLVREFKFKIGDKVNKINGYKFPGTVVACFYTLAGKERYVVEMNEYGLLHIFNGDQLELM